MLQSVNYILIIETDKYADTFARELCALLTLEYAECEVGKDIADYEQSLINRTPERFIQFVEEDNLYKPVRLSSNINAIEISLGEEIYQDGLSFILERLSLIDKIEERIVATGIRSYQKLQHIKIVSVDVIQETINRTHIYKVI